MKNGHTLNLSFGIRFNLKKTVISTSNRLCPVQNAVFDCDIMTAYVIRIVSYAQRADAYVNAQTLASSLVKAILLFLTLICIFVTYL